MKQELIDKLDELIKHVPRELDLDKTVKIMQKRGMLVNDVLLYRVAYIENPLTCIKEKMVHVKCSACGEDAYLEYVPGGECHNSYGKFGFKDLGNNDVTDGMSCLCPCCGKGVKALHIGSFKAHTCIDSHQICTVHNVKKHLTVLSWSIKKDITKDGEVRYFQDGMDGFIVVDKKMVRLKKYMKFMSSYSWLYNWEYTKAYSDELLRWDASELIGWNRKTVESTNCDKSALYEYMMSASKTNIGAYPGRYMQTYLKHNNAENLVRQGFSEYVTNVLSEATVYKGYYSSVFNVKQTGEFINWKETRPHYMLGVDKEDLPLVRELSFKTFWFFKEIYSKRGIKLSREQLKIAETQRLRSVTAALVSDVNGYMVPVVRLLNYIKKQRELYSDFLNLIDIDYIIDYWNMLYEVNGEMVESEIFPKYIMDAHDNMTERVQNKRNPGINKKIKKRLPKLLPMEYSDEETGLCIRVCRSQGELIREGRVLSHCVSSYANSYAEGRTVILFIRHIDKPDVPYFTLEWKNNAVNQNRGKNNCSRTNEVVIFEEKWLNYLKTLKENNDGKLSSRSKEQQYAGA